MIDPSRIPVAGARHTGRVSSVTSLTDRDEEM
jgi:hypothetical protein